MFAYGDMSLDRCTNQRKDKRWLKSEFNRDSTRFCVINKGMCLIAHDVLKHEFFVPHYLPKSNLPTLSIGSCIFLGKEMAKEASSSETAFFAIDFDKLRFSTQEAITQLGEWQELKQITPNLSAFDASLLSLAKAMGHWHLTHQFCGLCGESNLAVEAGHARRCTNCRNMTFPRTDPAVIMLVEKMFDDGIPRCLLGRQASWSTGVYSTMAGFVDPGETLEQAVTREVLEETGIDVERPHYIASQPWPFPGTIMLAFTAVAISEEINVSHDSLEDAQWFSREQLHSFGESTMTIEESHSQDKPQFKMSSKNSISAYLINAWKNKTIGTL